MKWIFGAIKLVLVFGFMALAFLLLINKTFINEVYLEDFMIGDGVMQQAKELNLQSK